MVDIVKIDHVVEGLDKLPSQWKDKPNIRGLLTGWLDPLNDLEESLIGVRDGFNINTAVGAQLDIIGAYFDRERLGRNDDDYRTLILTSIASSSGSGTPNELIDLFGSIAGTSDVRYWEHYPLSLFMVAVEGKVISPTAVDDMWSAKAACTEIGALVYDPNNYAWVGGETAKGEADLTTEEPTEDNIIDDLSNQIVVTAEYEIVGDGNFRSSFVDVSIDALVEGGETQTGYGLNYGEQYGGSLQGFSQLADASTRGNSDSIVNGGNGYLLWAGGDSVQGESEIDPVTFTTNKAEPIQQIKDSGLKHRQPMPRQFFNWMIAQIDSWFQNFANRAAVGTVKFTTDNTKTITDYGNQFINSDGTSSTWVYIGTFDVTASLIPVYMFKRTA